MHKALLNKKGINVVEVSYCLKKKRFALQVLFLLRCKPQKCFALFSRSIRLDQIVFLI